MSCQHLVICRHNYCLQIVIWTCAWKDVLQPLHANNVINCHTDCSDLFWVNDLVMATVRKVSVISTVDDNGCIIIRYTTYKKNFSCDDV